LFLFSVVIAAENRNKSNTDHDRDRRVEAACRRIPVDRAAVGPDGTISDPGFRAEAARVWDALLDYLGED
jgi:hypothetical protein